MNSFIKVLFGVLFFFSCKNISKESTLQEKNPLKNYLNNDTLRPWYLRNTIIAEEANDDSLFKIIKSKFYSSIDIKVNLYEQTRVCGECHKYQLLEVNSKYINIIIPLNDVVSYSTLKNTENFTDNTVLKIIRGVKMPKELNSLVKKISENKEVSFLELESFIDDLFTEFIIVSRDLKCEESELFWKIRTKKEVDSLDNKYNDFSKEYYSIGESEKADLPRKSSMYYSYNNSIYRVILSEEIEGEFSLEVELLYLEHFDDYMF